MGGLTKEQLFAGIRKKRKKRIARLKQIICEYLPATTPKKETVAKSIAEYAINNEHGLFITTKTMKRLNELPKLAYRDSIEYIELFNKFTSAIFKLVGALEQAIEESNVPPSHIDDAFSVFSNMEEKCHEHIDKYNETEANNPIIKQGRSKTGEAIFSLQMDEFLKTYSLPRKRKARIIAAIMLTLREQDITKPTHQKLANNIEQRIRNTEI